MKNVIKKQRLFSLFIILFSLFACAIENQNNGTLVIRMPGGTNARAVSDAFLDTLKYKIVCVGSATVEREAAPGETIPIPLAAGEWEVSITVFNAANEEINTAKIKETVTIKAGEPTTLKLVIPIDRTRCDITEFKITSPEKAEGKIEKDGNQISVTVPAGTDRRNMSFTFVHTGVSIAHPASPCDFTEPQTFMVTAEDDTKKEYTVTVTETIPGTITGVTATAVSSNSITVSWSAVTGATGYRIYRSTSSGGTFSEVGTSTTTSFTDTGLTAGTTYYYKVAAENSGGTSPQSNTVSAQPLLPPITSPTGIDLVYIPSGTFQMDGSDSGGTSRPVTLTSGFYMGKYEVTQEQYQAVMDNANPSDFKGDNLPVENVSWYDAIVFCNRLSIMEGLTPAYRISNSTNPNDWGNVPPDFDVTWNAAEIVSGATGYRLPTEAQWEYACRAGTTTAFNWGSNIINSTQANYDGEIVDSYNSAAGTYLRRTTEVGSYAPNAWGLYDMHGNVWEWCWDWYRDYSIGAHTDPTGTASGSSRVQRGGCWLSDGLYLRSAGRGSRTPFLRYYDIGFRLVRP